MFLVPVSRVPKQGTLKDRQELSPAELGLSEAFGGFPVKVSFELSAMGNKFLAKGKARATAALDCGRCLKPYTQPVDAEFVLEFDPEAAVGRASQMADPGDLEGYSVILFHGEAIPLGEEIRQELELSLPQRLLCGPDCKGLCDRCGADLNQGACSCGPRAARSPFTALKESFADLKENKNG